VPPKLLMCQTLKSGPMNAVHCFDDLNEINSLMNNPLDTRQLRAFVTLAKTASFTVAAKELNLSQSAVSHSIKALETDVGCRLLDRMGKKVLLTQAGEQLLHHAEKIMQEMSITRASLEELGKWGKGRLRIGTSATACQYILPAVLREFKESFPQYAISIEPGDALECVDALRNNRIDLALALEPEKEEQFAFHPLFSDELVFLVSPLHPWATAKSISRSEIPKQSYVLYSKKSQTFRMVEKYFRHEGMVLNTVIELGSMEAIKELVKLGLGIGILAPWIAPREIEERSLIALPLGKKKLKRNWGVFHWHRHKLSLAEETFVGLCRSATENLSTE
jgi:LysR family transcriptional regulator, low CO2-responsive transcriptional regulator